MRRGRDYQFLCLSDTCCQEAVDLNCLDEDLEICRTSRQLCSGCVETHADKRVGPKAIGLGICCSFPPPVGAPSAGDTNLSRDCADSELHLGRSEPDAGRWDWEAGVGHADMTPRLHTAPRLGLLTLLPGGPEAPSEAVPAVGSTSTPPEVAVLNCSTAHELDRSAAVAYHGQQLMLTCKTV